jgi:hypothetical protein
MAFGFGFGMPRSFAVPPFSPASLFVGGIPGVWYDPSDYSTLFQDSAGTTPVTAVEQPVGLMLDKSQGLVLGSELVTNGDFSNGTTNWTASSSSIANVSGELQVTNSGAVFGLGYQAIAVTPNKWHKISITFRAGTASIVYAQVKESVPSGASVFNQNTASKTNVTITGYFYATLSTYYVSCVNNNESNATGFFDNISVKELPGNHAFQATSASRPVLSARYNLLTKTEQFDDAAWFKSNVTITANTVIAPDGTTTADKLIGTAATDQKLVRPASLTAASGVYKLSCYMKVGEFSFAGLSLYDGTSYFAAAGFNLSTGTVTSTFGGSAAIEPAGNGWYLCSISGTAVGAIQAQFSGIRLYSSAPAGVTSNCVGDGTSGVYIWGASLVPANQSTLPYQRVNTATDYNTTGFLPYLKFDGVDDSLSTNSISFTSTDKMSVFAGVRKLSDAARAILVELSTSYGDVGTFGIDAPLSPTNKDYRFVSGGSLAGGGVATGNGFVAPITNVVTGLGNISGDLATLRVNGAQIAQGTGDQGTGNYGNYPLYIGRRGNSALPFNGQMYSMVIVGKAVTAGELSSTETYVNQKTGAY